MTMLASLTIRTGADWIVSAAAVLVSLGIIYRYVVRPIVAAHRSVRAALDYVVAEMKPNGGSSLRDAVNRIEHKVDNHEQRLVAVEEAVRALESKLREPVVSSTTTVTKVKTVEPAHIEEVA